MKGKKQEPKLFKNIRVTEFAKRHFDRKFGGTKILDTTVEQFETFLNRDLGAYYKTKTGMHFLELNPFTEKIMDGYAPFCKLIAIKNFTNAKTGVLPIKPEYQSFVRFGYSSRRDSELDVQSVWLDMPSMFVPDAEYLIVVVYDREQLEKEHEADMSKLAEEDYEAFEFASDDAEWGVVAILGQMHSSEEPMKPITMMRNSLGKEEGGSGVPLDREAYKKSVEFWGENITVK